jgi:hypothetical protein
LLPPTSAPQASQCGAVNASAHNAASLNRKSFTLKSYALGCNFAIAFSHFKSGDEEAHV